MALPTTPAFPRLWALFAATLLAGCATYSPLPLGHPSGADSVASLHVDASAMPTPKLQRYPFDPTDGLDATETAMLAVANSPQLKVRRDQLGIAEAQAFAAGLLPDPQLNLGADFPKSRASGLVTGYTLGLSEDLSALLTRHDRKQSAASKTRQVNLDLLWAEWQTVAKARLLFDQVRGLRARHHLLVNEKKALTPLARHVQAALKNGDLSYAEASAGLNALSDVEQQLTGVTTRWHKATADLKLLLGLAPDAPLDLSGAYYLPHATQTELENALASLPRRRPDLLALQAGYQAQDAQLREAILAQFPAITLGFNRARDTGNVVTNGFTLGITLPLFNRNRGQIAVAKATWQQLKDAYTTRLLTTRSDMQRIASDIKVLTRQRHKLVAHARQLDASRANAEQAWKQHLLDWPAYLAIRSQALAADMQSLAARSELARQTIALQTLLGSTRFPHVQASSS
ncbi:MAG TPA: TolC family protein [Rhodanobacteraceae bacterium]|nr:TolC family protein [Rhodanobacteraceae bacterium]